MTPLSQFEASWSAISALLDEALSLPAPERASWLEGLTGERASHREALRALLALQAQVETDDFLNTLPRLDTADTPSPLGRLAAGSSVGAYRLIAEIGQGGMGTVWLAERADGLMNRRVALKLPRIVWGDSFAERLAREREILSTLEHENIARLYDAGIDAHGRPFLAMEYVDGEPIDAYCRTHALPVRERVALLLQVMAAVGHAHSRLIVHRDLKPSNILVTREAKVKLLDFGIAKLLEGDSTIRTALTELSGRALTLDYASPEQIRGEPLGTASDVYSMGVVFYEMVTGSRPYRLKRASAAELEEAIASAEAPMASTAANDRVLARQLRGDLDSILNKALKKQPEERYATMDAFAQDLRRWRDGEPVLARPDGLAYRAAKFIGRNRLQVAAGGAVVLALVAGTTVAMWQAHEARLQAERAQTEAATARAVQGFMESVFKTNAGDQADPKRAAQTTARELLDRGAERIDSELAAAPMARLRLLGVFAAMYRDMVVQDKELEMHRKRLALARQLTGPASDETVLAMADTANVLRRLEPKTEAIAMLAEAEQVLDARHDQDSPLRLRVLMMQASLYARLDTRRGLAACEQALSIARRQPPGGELVTLLVIRGGLLRDLGRPEDALASFADAVQMIEGKPELGASQLAFLHELIGAEQFRLGNFPEARVNFDQAIAEIHRQGQAEAELRYAERYYATFLCDTGRYAESLERIRPALAWSRTPKAVGFGDVRAWMPLAYGRSLAAYGDATGGLAAINEALAQTEKMAKTPDTLEIPLLSIRAEALVMLGRLDEARAALDKARALADVRQLPRFYDYIDPVERRWLVASGKAAEALAAFKASGAARPAALKGRAGNVAALVESAWLSLEAGDAAAAQAQASQSLSAIDAGGLADYQRDLQARATLVLGRALLRQQRAEEALPVLDQAVALHRAVYDPDHSPAVAEARLALATAKEQARRIRTESTTRP